MLTTLAQLSDAFKTASVKPQTLRFDAQRSELRMQLEGANFESLERFKKLSEQAGFSVEEGAINNRDNRVVGTLALRRAI
jgi:general secretion pathway protein L